MRNWLIAAALLLSTSVLAQTPQTLHFTSGGNIVDNVYVPGAVGFNLADISSLGGLNRLPDKVLGLVYVSSSIGCGGDTSSFRAFVDQFRDNPKLWGFYLMDEPYVHGYGGKPPCSPGNLLAETRYIKSIIPTAKTYIKMGNSDGQKNPNYDDYYPGNTGIDVFGVGSYMCRSDFVGKPGTEDGCDWTMVDRYVDAAEKHIPTANLAPTYQAFSGWRTEASGGVFLMPTVAQTQKILDTWHKRLPTPMMEYAYAWSCQAQSTDCLSRDVAMQQVYKDWFAGRNIVPEPEPEPPYPESPETCAPCCK
jgi:serralysin